MILATLLVAGCGADMPTSVRAGCTYPGGESPELVRATAMVVAGRVESFSVTASTEAAADRAPGICSIDSNDFQDAEWSNVGGGVVFHTSNLHGEGLHDILITDLPDAIQMDIRSTQCSQGMLPFKVAIPKSGAECGVDWQAR